MTCVGLLAGQSAAEASFAHLSEGFHHEAPERQQMNVGAKWCFGECCTIRIPLLATMRHSQRRHINLKSGTAKPASAKGLHLEASDMSVPLRREPV